MFVVRNALCTLVCTTDACMNSDVELTVFKILFYEILVKLGIEFITKSEFILQGSDTNLEFNTLPFPKKVGLLTFSTIRFSSFTICTENGKL